MPPCQQLDRQPPQLAAEFAISRPSVSRHPRVLRDAGLVTWRGEAQRRLDRLDPGPLDDAGAWIEHTRESWANRLDALERHREAPHRARPERDAP